MNNTAMSLRTYLRTTTSADALLLAMRPLMLDQFKGALTIAYSGLRLKHMDGK